MIGRPKLDCDALLTADDFAAACGASVRITKLPNEMGTSLGACSRRIAIGDEFPFGNFIVNIYGSAEAAATLWGVDDKTPVVERSGVGDIAWVHESENAVSLERWIKVRKGSVGFWLRAHAAPGVTCPCTLEQLVAIASRIADRLP